MKSEDRGKCGWRLGIWDTKRGGRGVWMNSNGVRSIPVGFLYPPIHYQRSDGIASIPSNSPDFESTTANAVVVLMTRGSKPNATPLFSYDEVA